MRWLETNAHTDTERALVGGTNMDTERYKWAGSRTVDRAHTQRSARVLIVPVWAGIPLDSPRLQTLTDVQSLECALKKRAQHLIVCADVSTLPLLTFFSSFFLFVTFIHVFAVFSTCQRLLDREAFSCRCRANKKCLPCSNYEIIIMVSQSVKRSWRWLKISAIFFCLCREFQRQDVSVFGTKRIPNFTIKIKSEEPVCPQVQSSQVIIVSSGKCLNLPLLCFEFLQRIAADKSSYLLPARQ